MEEKRASAGLLLILPTGEDLLEPAVCFRARVGVYQDHDSVTFASKAVIDADLSLRPRLAVTVVISFHVLEIVADLYANISKSSSIIHGTALPMPPWVYRWADHNELPFSDSSSTVRNAGKRSRKPGPTL